MVGGDHSRFWNYYVPQMSVFEWKFGSYISLFKPLLLSLLCLIGISVSFRVSLAKVLHWFHGLVPGLRFGIYFYFLV